MSTPRVVAYFTHFEICFLFSYLKFWLGNHFYIQVYPSPSPLATISIPSDKNSTSFCCSLTTPFRKQVARYRRPNLWFMNAWFGFLSLAKIILTDCEVVLSTQSSDCDATPTPLVVGTSHISAVMENELFNVVLRAWPGPRMHRSIENFMHFDVSMHARTAWGKRRKMSRSLRRYLGAPLRSCWLMANNTLHLILEASVRTTDWKWLANEMVGILNKAIFTNSIVQTILLGFRIGEL